MRTFAMVVLMVFAFTPHAEAGRHGGGSSHSSSSHSSGSHSSVHSSGGHSSGKSGTGSSPSSHAVRGYTKKNGTQVAPHQQTDPDHTQLNNYSTKGNVNPSTGKTGTKPATH
jgi:hypothetical protein